MIVSLPGLFSYLSFNMVLGHIRATGKLVITSGFCSIND